MISNGTKWILAAGFALAAAGYLYPFWPLSVAGILLLALSGRYIAAFLVGLLLDVAYGAPVGRWHFLYVPFIILAVGVSVLRYYASSYMRQGDKEEL